MEKDQITGESLGVQEIVKEIIDIIHEYHVNLKDINIDFIVEYVKNGLNQA